MGNSIYRNRMSNLEGAKRDLEEASAILESAEYKVHKVENSENILDDIEAIMKEIPDDSISHLHFHYLGKQLTKRSWNHKISFQVTVNFRITPKSVVLSVKKTA